MILPCDDLFLRSKATQNPTYSVATNQRLNEVIERELVELFEREIKYQQAVERMKFELLSRLDWSFEGAFNAVDMRREGYLSADTFKLFLRLNGYTATQ
jgi:hypothetical protein